VGAESRGQFLADFLSEFPSIAIMNDEAHHVHSAKSKTSEELVWRKFLGMLRRKMLERHKGQAGIFVQYDFSATPFFGSGTKKIYFSHIVYDYDLISAMHAMLVKQLFLEKKAHLAGESFDFRAARKKAESGERQGEITGLSTGQLLMLEIGRKKLESLTTEFQSKGIDKKPVMMVLCEETIVADLVKDHFRNLRDEEGNRYDDHKVVAIHMSLKQSEKAEASRRLDKIDDNADPLNVVISVLMLREGFDRKNISVIVVLRASEADLLLEQVVGRGLRLMFPQRDNETIWQLKVESLDDIRRNKLPASSFDCLFIVDHPKFEKFYQRLREQGYLISVGDSSKVKPTGDIVPIDAIPLRLEEYDISWPVQIYEQGAIPDISNIDITNIPPYSQLDSFSELRESLGKMMIQDVHYETGKKTKAWKFDTDIFSYTMFLSLASRAVSEEGKTPILTGSLAEIAQVIDAYVSTHMFREAIDFTNPRNCLVLNSVVIFNHVITEVRRAMLAKLGELKYEQTGVWRKLSEVPRLMMREKNSVETWKTIYPRQAYAGYGGGFERDFMAGVLEQSAEVLAYAKLDRRHALLIPYRDEFGVLRDYEVDFIIKTEDRIYLVETKADKDLNDDTVLLKAYAAYSWCLKASKVKPLEGMRQPQKFEYLVLPEGIFKMNQGLGFDMFVPLCKEVRNKMIEKFNYVKTIKD
jgi:type III restriction enzyme